MLKAVRSEGYSCEAQESHVVDCVLIVCTNATQNHTIMYGHVYLERREKRQAAQRERGLSFEELVTALEAGGLLANLPHPNQQTYPHL